MTLRALSSIALAAALLASSGAFAEDTVQNVNLGGDAGDILSAHFGVTHTQPGDFVDTYNFSPTNGSWFVDSSLVTIGWYNATNIDFYAAEINGHAMTMTPNGTFEYGWLINEPIMGPLVLTVYGSTMSDGLASASYAGTINIAPAIPEPSTYGMLLGGMGVLAWLARRRQAV
ncbi:FxDxF family PEP-CTERM protein [Pseudoduganella buxea]|uniref:PEP-CTERM sorting domain-containing protein n=1 Tax=Pseudoduganella buxea TaxID=1949069 RepID=A0A6I3T439_9BURK|nr:FxDxF family PEP-CTERM protein [Pseudoduganella buxea]MTV56291.1 PEP-CTERM sorting domain-containing protein [Pseudoduganella buxea]